MELQDCGASLKQARNLGKDGGLKLKWRNAENPGFIHKVLFICKVFFICKRCLLSVAVELCLKRNWLDQNRKYSSKVEKKGKIACNLMLTIYPIYP